MVWIFPLILVRFDGLDLVFNCVKNVNCVKKNKSLIHVRCSFIVVRWLHAFERSSAISFCDSGMYLRNVIDFFFFLRKITDFFFF